MKDDDENEIGGIAGVFSMFFAGKDFDFKTLGKGLGAIVKSALVYYKSLTQTREGVGLSAFLLGIMLKQMNFKGTLDLFPITITNPLEKVDKNIEYCEILGGGIVECSTLTEEQLKYVRRISPKDLYLPPLTIPSEFGLVYVSDVLTYIGLGLMLGGTAMDMLKEFVRIRKV